MEKRAFFNLKNLVVNNPSSNKGTGLTSKNNGEYCVFYEMEFVEEKGPWFWWNKDNIIYKVYVKSKRS